MYKYRNKKEILDYLMVWKFVCWHYHFDIKKISIRRLIYWSIDDYSIYRQQETKQPKLQTIPIFGNFKEKYIMGKNTSVSLGEHFEKFVKYRIKEGRYKNASEVIRAGLRLLEVEEQNFYALKSAIEEGINSGVATDFNPDTFLDQLKGEKKQNG